MTSQMRQRLVGLLVIIAILAIFLPILFHNPNPISQIKLTRSIPPVPSMPNASNIELHSPKQQAEKTPVPQVQKAQNFELTSARILPAGKSVAAKLITAPSAEVTRSARKSQSVLRSQLKRTAHSSARVSTHRAGVSKFTQKAVLAQPQAWVVQVASFNSLKRGMALITRLRKEGFEAYSRSIRIERKLIVRVYVGPEIQYKNVKLLQQHIKKRYHLQGLIVKYAI